VEGDMSELFKECSKKRIAFLFFIILFLCVTSVSIFCLIKYLTKQPSIGNIPIQTVSVFTHPTSQIVQILDENGHEKYVLTKTSIEKYNVDRELVWKYDKIEYWMNVKNIIIDDKYLFFDNSEKTIALEKLTGKIVWEENHDEDIITSSEIIGSYNNYIFLEILNYGLYTIDKDNGRTVWSFHYFHRNAELSFFQDKVIIFLRDQVIVCDLFTGKKLDIVLFNLSYSLAQKDSTLYFGERNDSSSWSLESYELMSHKKNNLFTTSKKIQCLRIKEDNLFLIIENDAYKLNNKGEIVWRMNFGGNGCNSLIVSDKLILMNDTYNHLYGINSDTGESYGYIENYQISTQLKRFAFIDDQGKINIFLLQDHSYIQLREK
jgi:outer membrane protein assembly factor BamB